MKKAFVKYILSVIILLGVMANLYANATLNHSSSSHKTNGIHQAGVINSHNEFLPLDTKKTLDFEQLLTEVSENEEVEDNINTNKYNPFSYHDSLSAVFFHALFSRHTLERQTTLAQSKPVNFNRCKRYIQFEVFRI